MTARAPGPESRGQVLVRGVVIPGTWGPGSSVRQIRNPATPQSGWRPVTVTVICKLSSVTCLSARSRTANKIEITNALSIRYANIPCRISPTPQKAFNSHGPFTSISSILRLRKIPKGATHGLSLEESQPWVATSRVFCNHLSHLLPYVARPADATFARFRSSSRHNFGLTADSLATLTL